MLSRFKRVLLVFAAVICSGLLLAPELGAVRPVEKKPEWWLRDGMCFVGNWEPMAFRLRRGNVPRDWKKDWEWQHAPSTAGALQAAGINMVITHFYKGLGLEHERRELEYTRKLVDNLRARGMYAGAYIGSTLFSETLYEEVPGSENWVQLDHNGEPINYGDQYFRERADFTHQGYRDQIKKAVGEALDSYDMDLIHFDNFYTMFPLDAGYTEQIQQLFRDYLAQKYTQEQRIERLGFETVSLIRPPRVANRPMDPVTDPLVQEWITFRVEALTGFIAELSEFIRTKSDKAVVEFNPHGIWGENCAYTNGMDHARLLALSDVFWSEDPDHAHYFADQGRLVSKIRSYKLGRRFGNALFSYNQSPLELAEAMAFGRMCLGDVVWEMASEPEKYARALEYIDFFNKNKELFRDLETIDDVGVMRDFESLTFGGWTPFLNTVQAEQALLQSRAPFTLLFDRDWQELAKWKVVVLASQENLSDEEIAQARDYVRGGGALVVVGATGRYDQWRRLRSGEDTFWSRLGLPQFDDAPATPAESALGKGRVLYLPGFENDPAVPATAENVHPDYWYLPLNWEEFVAGVRRAAGGEFTVAVESMPWVVASQYRKGGAREVHLVNYRPGHGVRHVPVVISEPGFKPKGARLYSPDHDTLELPVSRYGDGWLTLVPELDIYGVLVVE